MHDVVIVGLGTALPGKSIPTESFIEHAKTFAFATPRQEKVLEELYRRTTIATRSSVLAGRGYGERAEEVFVAATSEFDRGPSTAERMQYYALEVPHLAQQACDAAFAAAPAISKNEITHIVTVSCTGFHAPGFDVELIESLALNPSTKRTHIGFMGCHGGMNGLRVALAYAQSDPHARILLCAAETCSLHFQYGWGPDRLVANSLFADGAAAAIITPAEPAQGDRIKIVDTASYIVPDSKDQMLWRIGDHGFEMHLAATVPSLIEQWLPQFLSNWLSKNNLSVQDVASWAVHPGGPKILDAVEHCLELAPNALKPSRDILASCGNMSSPTVFFIIEKLKTHGHKGPCVVLGFGPGLTVEAALIDI